MLQSKCLNLPPVRAMRLSSSCHIPSGTDKYYYTINQIPIQTVVVLILLLTQPLGVAHKHHRSADPLSSPAASFRSRGMACAGRAAPSTGGCTASEGKSSSSGAEHPHSPSMSTVVAAAIFHSIIIGVAPNYTQDVL